jgi:hypothetical protein
MEAPGQLGRSDFPAPEFNSLETPKRLRVTYTTRRISSREIPPPHAPLSLLRIVFEADETRRPAERAAGLLKRNLNTVCFSSYGHNDGGSYLRIGDALERTHRGTHRGSRRRQSD